MFKPRLGKLVAQGAHACLKVFLDRKLALTGPDGQPLPILGPTLMDAGGLADRDEGPQPFTINGIPNLLMLTLTDDMAEWVESLFTKIVLGVSSEEHLLEVVRLAEEAGIPHALIQDAGKTEFRATCGACGGSGRAIERAESYATHGVWAGLGFLCKACNGKGTLPVPTYTVVALGPHDADEIDKITGPDGAVPTKLL